MDKPIERITDMLMKFHKYPDEIYVRDQGENGKWGNFSLSELSLEKRVEHEARMIVDKVIKRP